MEEGEIVIVEGIWKEKKFERRKGFLIKGERGDSEGRKGWDKEEGNLRSGDRNEGI